MGSLRFSDIFPSPSIESDMLECAFFVTCMCLSARRCFCTIWLALIEKALLTTIKCLLVQIVLSKNISSFLLRLFEKITKRIVCVEPDLHYG